MASDVAVIGGGVVGVFIAEQLASHGASVTLIERDLFRYAASYGNAGLIVPSYSIPMATPAALKSGIKALVGEAEGLSISLRPDAGHLAFLLRFAWACRPAKVVTSIPVLAALTGESAQLYDRLFSGAEGDKVGYRRAGWLNVYRHDAGLLAGIADARRLAETGIRWRQVDGLEAREIEPALTADLAGGVFHPDDANIQPGRLVRYMLERAKERGVQVRHNVRVRRLQRRGRQVYAAATDGEEVTAGRYVIAAGVYTPQILKGLPANVPVQPAKGFSMTYPAPEGGPSVPVNLADEHVVVSPMGESLRLTGGLDLAGMNRSLSRRRTDALWLTASRYMATLAPPHDVERWFGYRPMTPDAVPIIGPLPGVDNVVIAAGHGTLGVTLAPVSARLVRDFVIDGVMPPAAVLPSRFVHALPRLGGSSSDAVEVGNGRSSTGGR